MVKRFTRILMGDISKAKHASSNTLVRGKHAKHARVVENTHPSCVRYAAGTFLVSSAIALGLFAVLPFSASETVDVGETQTASATQENLMTKSAQATQKNVGSSAQNSPLVQSQSTNDSDNQEATTADPSATDSEESTPALRQAFQPGMSPPYLSTISSNITTKLSYSN